MSNMDDIGDAVEGLGRVIACSLIITLLFGVPILVIVYIASRILN